jgi:hypothetical protein
MPVLFFVVSFFLAEMQEQEGIRYPPNAELVIEVTSSDVGESK